VRQHAHGMLTLFCFLFHTGNFLLSTAFYPAAAERGIQLTSFIDVVCCDESPFWYLPETASNFAHSL